jgi:beta-glucanase (GH16 family)
MKFTSNLMLLSAVLCVLIPFSGNAVKSKKVKPQLYQEFNPGWENKKSQDGLWIINGPWIATGKNLMYPANVTFTKKYEGDKGKGYMYFKSLADTMKGAEVQTLASGPCYGYGYYEVRMKLTPVGDPDNNTGVCASFFWKKKNYQRAEWDLEFLTNGKWVKSENEGQVTMNHHLDNGKSKGHYHDLGFNPSKAFHRYGILYQPNRLDWTVDGKIVYSVEDPAIASGDGFIMMNSWTGNKNWGGLAPKEDAVTVYDWVKFYPGVTEVPNQGK